MIPVTSSVARIFWTSSMPSIPGILRSVTTMWGPKDSYLPSALKASAAVSTS
jgi:hypothetical protein